MSPERSVVALREKAIYIDLGVPVFFSITGVAKESVVTEAFQIAVNIEIIILILTVNVLQ